MILIPLLSLCIYWLYVRLLMIVNHLGVQYVISNVIGKIHVVLAGHTHEDCLRTDFSVPCVVTTQFMKNDNPTFDLCLLDYDNGYLEMIRVGEGVNRKVKLNTYYCSYQLS